MKPHIDYSQSCMINADSKLENENLIVAGHKCEGLDYFNGYGSGCTPKIYENGFITGCDDCNPVRIAYCPFCGEKLVFE